MLFVLGWLLAAVAMALLAYDGMFLLSWGFDLTEVAGVSDSLFLRTHQQTQERVPL